MVRPSNKVRLPNDVSTRIVGWSLKACPHETGGILLGWREGNTVVVIDALEITPQSPSSAGYILREDEANAILTQHLQRVGTDQVGYVGSWHSHPEAAPPSGVDLRTFALVAVRSSGPTAFVVAAVDRAQVVVYSTWASASGPRSKVRALTPQVFPRESERDD